MKIDESSIEIIKRLRDGRASYKKIAEDLSLSENTVRSRVKKLEEQGVLEISGLVDPEALKGHSLVRPCWRSSTGRIRRARFRWSR